MNKSYSKERGTFRALLLTNPNYFGNLKNSKLEAVNKIVGNITYEELKCVGYQPQQQKLEAVVHVYQKNGYETDICGIGTPEYVRFYLSYDDGNSWVDQGLTSFQSYNIPEGTEGAKYLEYAVSLKVDPKRKFCFQNPIIKVRAILSWNAIPPTNQANWLPVWGNVIEEQIFVEPKKLIVVDELIATGNLKVSNELKHLLNPSDLIPLNKKKLDLVDLSELYKEQKIPINRFAFKEISQIVSGKSMYELGDLKKLMPQFELELPDIDIFFPQTDGNTSYEELKCIGLDSNNPNTLVGIIQVKKNAGYSGGPCTTGSEEFITFWADFDDNGSFETCLGTASVQVYDVSNIPNEGVYYAVRLPVNLDKYRQSCQLGAKIVKIRAILSWNEPIDCSTPNKIPIYGNREETLVHISEFSSNETDGKISILGGIPTAHIDDISGMTLPTAFFADNNLAADPLGRACPFGRRLSVHGVALPGHSYLVEAIPVNNLGIPIGAPNPLVTNLQLTRSNGTTHTHTADPVTKRFNYIEFNNNVNSLLAQWDSNGDEKWAIKLSVFDGANALVSTDTQLIQLDNTAPEVFIKITSGAGDCGKFDAGSTLSGTFKSTDANLDQYNLSVIPNINDPGEAIANPKSGMINTNSGGEGFSLDTDGMEPCGYVLRIVAVDRSILNNHSHGNISSSSVGFCLD